MNTSNSIQPGSMKNITDNKLVAFAIGKQTKSRFQKAREEKELKKKQDENEAAQVYDDFVASFTNEDDANKVFIRGGKINNSGSTSEADTSTSGDVYRMVSKSSNETRSISSSTNINKPPTTGKNKQIDEFLNELMNKHESSSQKIRNDSLGQHDDHHYRSNKSITTAEDDSINNAAEKGSFDNGDPNTTNLYLGNLAPSTTEEHLLEIFGKFGAINSVKVMWPRTEEEKSRKRNCGFVSFKRRCDAEDALLELQDILVEDYKMAVCWGKAVKISSTPFTLPVATSSYKPPPPPNLPIAPPSMPILHHTQILPPTMQPPPMIPNSTGIFPLLPPAPPPALLITQQPAPDAFGGMNVFRPPLPPSLPSMMNDTLNKSSLPNMAAPPIHMDEEVKGNVNISSNNNSQDNFSHMSIDTFLESMTAAVSNKPPLINNHVHAPPETNPVSQVLPPPPPLAAAAVASGNIQSPHPIFVPPPPFAPPLSATSSVLLPHHHLDANKIIVSIPSDPVKQALIDLVAKYTAIDGFAFESRLKANEEYNPDYAFLFDDAIEEGIYYRWRTYANVWGDTDSNWSTVPLQWSVSGMIVVPPAIPQTVSAAATVAVDEQGRREQQSSRSPSPSTQYRRNQSYEESHNTTTDKSILPTSTSSSHRENIHTTSGSSSRKRSRSRDRDRDRDRDRRRSRSRERDREKERVLYAGMTGAQIERARTKDRMSKLAKLSKEDYREWKRLLQVLSLSRETIKEAMGFAFDKIESSEEIVSMIRDRLIIPSSYPAVKIAGLYLLSDLLHNAGAPIKHASGYRTLVQNVLPIVLENIGILLRKTSGRMSAFNIEDRVKKLFTVWAAWSIFPASYLTGLQATFYMSESEHSKLQEYIQFKTNTAMMKLTGVDPTTTINTTTATVEEDDIDGVPLLNPITTNTTTTSFLTNTDNMNENIEILRKKAKSNGVPFNDNTSMYELEYRLNYYNNYVMTKFGQAGVPSISTFMTTELPRSSSATTMFQQYDNTDVINNNNNTTTTTTTSNHYRSSNLSYLEQLVQNDKDDVYTHDKVMLLDDQDDDIDGIPIMNSTVVIDGQDDDDDIDGIPLSTIVSSYTSHSSSYPTINTTNKLLVPIHNAYDDDDDIDGMPITINNNNSINEVITPLTNVLNKSEIRMIEQELLKLRDVLEASGYTEEQVNDTMKEIKQQRINELNNKRST